MLRLNAPLWLIASRTADPVAPGRTGSPVPREEHVHFDSRSLEWIEDVAGRGAPWIAFSRRLGEQFLAEGHLPIGFVEIVRTALDEREAIAPMRLIACSSDGREEIVEGIGLCVENVEDVADAVGDSEAARNLKCVALSLAKHVSGIEAGEFAVVDEAVRAKYPRGTDGSLPPEAARAAASLVAQFVEARTRESLSHDPAEQIALFVDALLRDDPSRAFLLEASRIGAPVSTEHPRRSLPTGLEVAPNLTPAAIPTPTAISTPTATPTATATESVAPTRNFASLASEAVAAPLKPRPQTRFRGTVFSRDPATGAKGIVVCARRDDEPNERIDGRRLARCAPSLRAELSRRCCEIEVRHRSLVAASFESDGDEIVSFALIPVEVSAECRLVVNVALVHEGLISRGEAVARLADLDLSGIRPRGVLRDEVLEPIACGSTLAPGAVSGKLALSGRQALAYRRCGFDVVLIRDGRGGEAASLDLPSAQGVVVLASDASTSLARAARRLAIPAIATEDVRVDLAAGLVHCGATSLREGESVTLDANAGCLYAGTMPIVELPPPTAKAELHSWRISESASIGQRA